MTRELQGAHQGLPRVLRLWSWVFFFGAMCCASVGLLYPPAPDVGAPRSHKTSQTRKFVSCSAGPSNRPPRSGPASTVRRQTVY